MKDWLAILQRCGVRPATAARWAPVFTAEIGDGLRFSAGESELDDFLGQILHESGMLERVEENLSYSAERLMSVWPSRFPTLEAAAPYARNPALLADKVYGGRMGNTQQAGDGWRYRGRGLMQITGRENYRRTGAALGVDLEGDPDQLAQPKMALRASIAWWERNIPDAVMGDLVNVTRRVNGGTNGIQHRADVTRLAAQALMMEA